MEGDKRKTKNTYTEEISDGIANISDVLQPSWLRCPICAYDKIDGVLLDYGYYLLRPVAIVFWIILLVASIV
jgi:hypothetical protein